MIRRALILSTAVIASLAAVQSAQAFSAYGVTANGTLFHFDTDTPAVVNTIGNIGFVPEGIDFRPATNQLFAIDVGAVTTQLYTLNPATAAPTAVGVGFATPAGFATQPVGMDFNPVADRLRLVSGNGGNIRINPNDGSLAATDTALTYAAADPNTGNAPFVTAVAYTNNKAGALTTTLYDLDPRHADLAQQGSTGGTPTSPNSGILTTVGQFGVTITTVSTNTGFDILSDNAGDHAFAVLTRPDAPIGGPLGAYLLYSVNLGTGSIFNGALVGGGLDFTGGFTLAPVPEPASLGLFVAGALLLTKRRR